MVRHSQSNPGCRRFGLEISKSLLHRKLFKSLLKAFALQAPGADRRRWIQPARQPALWVKSRRSSAWIPAAEYRRSLLVLLILMFMSTEAIAQDEAAFYRTNCAACHTIGGGPRVGPDLKGVTQRRDRHWLLEFMQNPKKVVDSGDAYAKSLVKNSHGLVMPTLPGLDHERAEALLNFLDKGSGSAQGEGGFATATTARPITVADISRGKAIFIGRRPLANRGPACISCHNVAHAAPLGGGGLGPDLTESVERLGGVSSITAWLGSPPTPTMRATYRGRALQEDEVRELVAYLQSAGAQSKAHAGAGGQWRAASFFLIGLAGCLGVLGLMELFWKNRFRAVRRPLVTKRRQSW